MERMEHISIATFVAFSRISRALDFGKFIIWRFFFDEQKSKKIIWIKVGLEQVIAIYIVQSETMVVFLELFKRENIFHE